MNEPETKIPPPVMNETNVSIHLGYIRRDIDEIKSTVKRLENVYVTRIDFDEHLKRDDDHEARIRILEKSIEDISTVKKLVYGCVSLILVAVISAIIYLVIIPHG